MWIGCETKSGNGGQHGTLSVVSSLNHVIVNTHVVLLVTLFTNNREHSHVCCQVSIVK